MLTLISSLPLLRPETAALHLLFAHLYFVSHPPPPFYLEMASEVQEEIPVHEEFFLCGGVETQILKCGPWTNLFDTQSVTRPKLLIFIIPGKSRSHRSSKPLISEWLLVNCGEPEGSKWQLITSRVTTLRACFSFLYIDILHMTCYTERLCLTQKVPHAQFCNFPRKCFCTYSCIKV